MAGGDKGSNSSGTTLLLSKNDFDSFIYQTVDNCIDNILQDVVLSTYATEKKLRMQSAAVQAEAAAAQAAGIPITPSGSAPSSAKPGTVQATGPPQGQYATSTAMWDNGKITLRGNPFKTLRENYCPSCKLPRLMFPLAGDGMRIPEDISRQYCTLHPFIRKPGHDIYGNPFPVDPGKTKKEREAIRKAEARDKDNTPGSADTGADGEGGADAAAVRKLMAGGKGASYIPWHTCPNCKRSLLITKFAQHLEKCMGIGGRTARNAAAARLSGINGSGNVSTQGSRNGTPTPSHANGKRVVDDDDDDEPPKKKVKKDKKEKKHKSDKEKDLDKNHKISLKLKMKHNEGGDAKLSKLSKLSSSIDAADKPSGSESSGKRERDEAGADDPPKKKMKVAKDGNSLMRKTGITAGAQ